jgi:hypothetical protein
MKGVGVPKSEMIVGASRSVLGAAGLDGSTGHTSGLVAEAALTWRIKSTGAASA